ncbi:hypothetical protein [Bacillus vallismortis]|uniref:hypothetical protein n=1 Tax=Bacillus vallismortis TaxID=72361 RepID=UPI003F59C396
MEVLIILPLLFSSWSIPLKHTIIAILLGALLLAVMSQPDIYFFDPAYMVIRHIRITDFLDRSDRSLADPRHYGENRRWYTGFPSYIQQLR